MNDGQNLNQIILDCVENAIRKPWRECAAHARDKFWVQEQNLLKAPTLKFKSQLNSEPSPLLCSSYQSNASPISRTARPENFRRYATNRFLNAPLLDPRNIPPPGCAQSRPNALRVQSLARVKLQWLKGRLQYFPKSPRRAEFATARAVPKYRQQKFGSWP